MADGEVEKKMEEKMVEKGGELLFCGGTSWDNLGRKGTPIEANLISPTRLRPLIGVDILSVASGGTSCHCVALDVEGRCYTWGRNDKGQLGHGDTLQRDTPTIVSGLSKYKIIRAGAGRAHTLVVTEDGKSFSFGWNKHGQLGTGSLKNEFELSPVCCLVSEVTTAVCGADFTVWLTSSEGESILTAGLPQYGQLGHGTDNEYNTKDSSVKLAYEPQPCPKAIASFAGKTIVKVACGTNHTVVVDSKGFLYTWGYGGHGRLGHREQKDEWSPRPVEVFQRQNVLPLNAVVSAGSANSACTAGGGQLYIWGKVKSSGDDWMYPKPLLDLRIVEMAGFLGSISYMASKSYLRIGDVYSIPSVHHQLDHFPTLLSFVTSGWNIRCMDSGSMHHFVGADDSCISWGLSQYGELGYGPMGPKSSANPKKVEILNGMHVISVACGLGHSMIVVDRTNAADKLDQLEIYECKATPEGNGEIPKAKVAAAKKATRNIAVKASSYGKKRKSKDSSESEEEEENESDDEGENSSEDDGGNSSEDSDGDINDKKEQRGVKTSSRGRGRGAKKPSVGQSTGRGRGRPPAEEKKSSQRGRGTGKRGRPRKS